MAKRTLIKMVIWATASIAVASAQPDFNAGGKAVNPPSPIDQGRKFINVRLLSPEGQPIIHRGTFTAFMNSVGKKFWGHSTSDVGLISVSADWKPDSYTFYVYEENVGSALATDTATNWDGAAPRQDLQLQKGSSLYATARDKSAHKELFLGGAEMRVTFLPHAGKNSADGAKEVQQEIFVTAKRTIDGVGSVEIPNLLPGRYKVEVPLLLDFLDASQEIEIKAGTDTKISFDLERNVMTQCKVIVRDDKGQPVANTKMDLYFQMNDEDRAQRRWWGVTSLLRTIVTNAQGEAMLYPMRPGTWNVDSRGTVCTSKSILNVTRDGGEVTLVTQQEPVRIPPPRFKSTMEPLIRRGTQF